MPSIANPPPSPKLTSLEDAFDARLVAQHPKKLGLTNAERSNEDQKNHERALRYLAAAQAGTEAELVGESEWVSARQKLISRRKKRPPQKGFAYKDCPAGLKRDWDAFAAWKMSDFVPLDEHPYHGACRLSTMEGKRNNINPYFGFLVQEQKIADPTLLDVATPTRAC